MTSLAPDAHAKMFATTAAEPHACVLTVTPGNMLTSLASVSNKQCSLLDVVKKIVKQALVSFAVQTL